MRVIKFRPRIFREQCVKFAEMDICEQLYEAFCQPGLRNFESIGPLELKRLSKFMVHYLNQHCCYSLPAVSRRSDDFSYFFFKSSAEQITFEVTQ